MEQQLSVASAKAIFGRLKQSITPFSAKELIKADGESHINIVVDNVDENILNEYEIHTTNNTIDIKSKNPDKDIPNIINKLTKANISINKLDVKKANLEDVFVKLTGKSLINDK